jgi:hypothetical protein
MRSQKALLEEVLRAADPLTESDEDLSLASGDELLASIVTSDPRNVVAPGARGKRRPPPKVRRRRYLVAVPLVAALLAMLVAGLPGGDEKGPSTLPVLARVAQAAAAQPPIDSDLPYFYMKTQFTGISTAVTGGHGWSYYAPTTRELWIAKDGSGRLRIIEDPRRWVGAADREGWEASGSPPPFPQGQDRDVIVEEDVPAGRFRNLLAGGTAFSELPTDASDLAAWLEQRVQDPKAGAGAGNGFSIAVRSLAFVTEILSNPFAPPELRAALYEAEGQIPGIEYLGPVTDELGRHGVAVGAESANSGAPTIYSLVFDPKTSQVLASQEKVLEAPAALSDLDYPRTESVLYLKSGATSSLGAKPRMSPPTAH